MLTVYNENICKDNIDTRLDFFYPLSLSAGSKVKTNTKQVKCSVGMIGVLIVPPPCVHVVHFIHVHVSFVAILC